MMRRPLPLIFLLLIPSCYAWRQATVFKTIHLEKDNMSIYESMYQIDRPSLALSDIPKTGSAKLERHYDMSWNGIFYAYLRFKGKSYKEITFSVVNEKYEYLWEQEIYYGPNKFRGEDSEEQERLEVYYYLVNRYTGKPSLDIRYAGPEALSKKAFISIDEARTLLKKWGYQ